MRYMAFAYKPTENKLERATDASGNIARPAETVEAAQRELEAYIAKNKAYYANGYDAFVLDLETKQIVATAGIPTPKLEWTTPTPTAATK